ncbi:MAG TPA: hypothetical protein VGO47_11525 [Chlamydiales bacterium]|nr:hypothetical protein [Chlamydiales bacterium]
MALPTQTKAWIVQNKAEKDVDLSSGPNATFAVTTLNIPSLIPEDSLLVKPVILSNDPAHRLWLQKDSHGMKVRMLYYTFLT